MIPKGFVRGICVMLIIVSLVMIKEFLWTKKRDSFEIREIDKVFEYPFVNTVSYNYSSVDQKILIQQRNAVSRLLNQKQQVIGRQKCKDLAERKTSKEEITDAGGWCPIASKTKHFGYDKGLATALSEFFKGKTVGSFGDGPGKYKKSIFDTGLVKVFDAYDGAPFCEETSNGLVQFLDLSIPQYGLPVYDWILCLEVAEHIPKEFEAVLLDNIVRHAREGVILSWARPGQTGYSHINNQSPEYVKACMLKLGFKLDIGKTEQIKANIQNENLKQNVNVYVRTVNELSINLLSNA